MNEVLCHSVCVIVFLVLTFWILKGVCLVLIVNCRKIASNRNDSGLLSWFGLGGSSYDTRETKPTPDQQQLIKVYLLLLLYKKGRGR